jgi:hypothetical protein
MPAPQDITTYTIRKTFPSMEFDEICVGIGMILLNVLEYGDNRLILKVGNADLPISIATSLP